MNAAVRGGDRLLLPCEAAQELGVGVPILRQWAQDRRLPSVRTPGGHHRYAAADVAAFAAARSRKRSPRPPAAAAVDGGAVATAQALCREYDLLANGEVSQVHPVPTCACRWCAMTRGMAALLRELAWARP